MSAQREQDVNFLDDIFPRVPGAAIHEGERLTFAKQILLGLALISSGIMVAFACYPENSALAELFEIIKIGGLPMATLVISFYFTNGSKK